MSRPTSATKISINHSNSSINFKKLHPINCISHYQTPDIDNFNDNGVKNGNRTTRAASQKWGKGS